MHILILDDQEVVRLGAKHALAQDYPGCHCHVANTGREAEILLSNEYCDLVLLELEIGAGAGWELLRGIVTRYPAVAVLAFSTLSETKHAARALRLGARGFVGKSVRLDEFLDAVRTVLAGNRYVSPTLVNALGAMLTTPPSPVAKDVLSARELQVASALAQGTSLTAAAQAMGISVKTVGTYRTRALAKLGLKSNAELARAAEALALLPASPAKSPETAHQAWPPFIFDAGHTS